jgi:hypothetical protein
LDIRILKKLCEMSRCLSGAASEKDCHSEALDGGYIRDSAVERRRLEMLKFGVGD